MLYSLGVIIMCVKYLRIILLWVVLLPFVVKAQPVSVSLDIPEYVVFAGDTLDIRRYDLRERYDREQLSFMYMHSSSLQIVRRANRYFPIIEPILKREGVPDDFKYLAVIESSLNPLAYSPAKAAGMWQFLASTGKEYGLEVSEEVDERYHVEKATVAACRYLKDARERLGSWVNAAAAYNAGLNRISGEQEKQRVESALDMRLVSETSRYVFRIMAAKAFLEDPQRFGFYLKKKGYKYKKNVIVGFIMAALLCIYGSFTFIFANVYSHGNEPIVNAEQMLSIDIPEHSRINTQDWTKGTQSVPRGYIYSTSDIYFDDAAVEQFEKNISNDVKWISDIPNDMVGITSYFCDIQTSDYYIIYNKDTKEFNKLPSESGTYVFINILYNAESNTMNLVEYQIEYTK